MTITPGERPGSDFPETIGNPARRALASAGYTRLEQLTAVSTTELLQLHGVGPKALRELGRALRAQGLAFADDAGNRTEDGDQGASRFA